MFRQLIISAGFPSKQASILLQGLRGFENIKKYWECFDPQNNRLSEFINPSDIHIISEAQTIRNNLVHGKNVYKQEIYKEKTTSLLKSLNTVRNIFQQRYGFDGWGRIKPRKVSTLHIDPKVILKPYHKLKLTAALREILRPRSLA